jgi:hypothetical protein
MCPAPTCSVPAIRCAKVTAPQPIQPTLLCATLSNWVSSRYRRQVRRLPLTFVFYMLQMSRRLNDIMLRLTNFKGARCRRWCAAVVLVAVSALTVSVTTRYGYSRPASNNGVRAVQKHASPELSRQRLIRDAVVWTPPVVSAFVLQAPTSYPRISPSGPPIPGLRLEKNLYNRPPPSLASQA